MKDCPAYEEQGRLAEEWRKHFQYGGPQYPCFERNWMDDPQNPTRLNLVPPSNH